MQQTCTLKVTFYDYNINFISVLQLFMFLYQNYRSSFIALVCDKTQDPGDFVALGEKPDPGSGQYVSSLNYRVVNKKGILIIW